MTAALPPEPQKPDPLTDRERQRFAEIADELRVDDAELADIMAREGWILVRFALPIRVKPVVARVVGALLVLIAAALMPAAWWSVVGLLVVLFGVPFLVLGAMWREDD